MPNIILEKGGQRYVFGLHTDRSVMNGNYITVPFNGADYYARIGDESTPLKVFKSGRWYSVQYNPISFSTFHRALYVSDFTSFEENIYFPKGRYRVIIEANGSNVFEFRVWQSGYHTVHGWIRQQQNPPYRIRISIDGLVDEESQNVRRDGTIDIERLGD